MTDGVVRLRQRATGEVSVRAHEHLGGDRVRCRPMGVRSEILATPDGVEVDCARCLSAWAKDQRGDTERPLYPPPDRPMLPVVDFERPMPEEPYGAGESMTLGELLAFIHENKDHLDMHARVRVIGRFDARSKIGFTASQDGSLCVQGVG